MDAALQLWQQSVQWEQQIQNTDRFFDSMVFFALLKLAQRDVVGASVLLGEAEQFARRNNFMHRMPQLAAVQVLAFLYQGKLATAFSLAQEIKLPICQARVHLAQGENSVALEVLKSYCQQVEAKGWADERLKVVVLQAVALHASGEKDKAVERLGDALALAEPGGFIRTFVDEGPPMAEMLAEAAAQEISPYYYVAKLLAACKTDIGKGEEEFGLIAIPTVQSLVEPLSRRELEVLQLIAQGLSNHEISERLFLALSTVKGHNLKIFEKLQVQRRTEAVARARQLGLL
jgi:LuxR family maltose regulon positive regulatory protein